MPRFCALVLLFGFIPFAISAELSAVEKQIAIQHAMEAAEQYLKDNMPTQATHVLEQELSKADGNKAYLALLKRAYLSEMALLMNDPTQNANRLKVQRKLDILLGANPATPPSDILPASPVAAPGTTSTEVNSPGPNAAVEAANAFKKGDYAQAEQLYSSIGVAKLSQEQKAAWACCRIRMASAKVNALQCDCDTAAAAANDVAEAIKLVPQNSELQKLGQQVIAVANFKANCRAGTRPGPTGEGLARPVTVDGDDVVVTASFRVRHTRARELAETVAKAAENSRKAIFERWSGPAFGAWEPKCEIVIHPNAETLAREANRPAGSTGRAIVQLVNGRPSERKIDLRADDVDITSNALPRELTHIVLADLFPDKPPPRWAEEGMAVLAGTSEETGRYTTTLRRCARDGDWFGVPQLMEMKEFPADKITGFFCESVSLTEYLVKARGDKNFTLFLRDSQRYGLAQALRRQYQIDGPQALEAAWKHAALEVGRAQAP
jgi:hypothetical protein